MILSEQPIEVTLGQRLVIIPNHVCPTVNVHGGLVVLPEAGEPYWETIVPRGWQTDQSTVLAGASRPVPRDRRGGPP